MRNDTGMRQRHGNCMKTWFYPLVSFMTFKMTKFSDTRCVITLQVCTFLAYPVGRKTECVKVMKHVASKKNK